MNIFINARIGDGCFHKYSTCKHWSISFSSINKPWIEHKHEISSCSNSIHTREQSIKAYGKRLIYQFHMTSKEADEYAILPVESLIERMDVYDLIWLYLDDGSWHKKKHYMHIYTNSLSKLDNMLLINHMNHILNIKPKLRIDRKKNGKEYYYLALSVSDSNSFKVHIVDYLKKYPNLSCFNYKVGLYE